MVVTAQARQLKLSTRPLFVPLNSDNHVLLDSEPACRSFCRRFAAFLEPAENGADAAIEGAGPTPAEAEVLRLMAQGLDNAAIARQWGKSVKTVRNQVSVIFDKVGVRTRAEAVVRVRAQRRGGTGGD